MWSPNWCRKACSIRPGRQVRAAAPPAARRSTTPSAPPTEVGRENPPLAGRAILISPLSISKRTPSNTPLQGTSGQIPRPHSARSPPHAAQRRRAQRPRNRRRHLAHLRHRRIRRASHGQWPGHPPRARAANEIDRFLKNISASGRHASIHGRQRQTTSKLSTTTLTKIWTSPTPPRTPPSSSSSIR